MSLSRITQSKGSGTCTFFFTNSQKPGYIFKATSAAAVPAPGYMFIHVSHITCQPERERCAKITPWADLVLVEDSDRQTSGRDRDSTAAVASAGGDDQFQCDFQC